MSLNQYKLLPNTPKLSNNKKSSNTTYYQNVIFGILLAQKNSSTPQNISHYNKLILDNLRNFLLNELPENIKNSICNEKGNIIEEKLLEFLKREERLLNNYRITLDYTSVSDPATAKKYTEECKSLEKTVQLLTDLEKIYTTLKSLNSKNTEDSSLNPLCTELIKTYLPNIPSLNNPSSQKPER